MQHVTSENLNEKSILITGATGSFGQAFVSECIKQFTPSKVIVFSRDELKQHEMSQIYAGQNHECMRYFLGDVRDESRLEMAMRGVDIVIHAAALKQVPAAEYNPFECICTNVHGAENIVRAATRVGVPKVLALSTDKAANPINLYGASKLAADKIFVAANNISGGRSRFSVVRYGNVIGSRGSVIPFYKKLILEKAKALPVTDKRMTRFWITVKQGVEFVLSSLKMMQGGEIFVPKIPSMKITELASALAPELPQEEIGIRPGEKLHETMITTDDARNTLELDDRYIIRQQFYAPEPNFDGITNIKTLPDGFHYSSDSNSHWLSRKEMLDLILAE